MQRLSSYFSDCCSLSSTAPTLTPQRSAALLHLYLRPLTLAEMPNKRSFHQQIFRLDSSAFHCLHIKAARRNDYRYGTLTTSLGWMGSWWQTTRLHTHTNMQTGGVCIMCADWQRACSVQTERRRLSAATIKQQWNLQTKRRAWGETTGWKMMEWKHKSSSWRRHLCKLI